MTSKLRQIISNTSISTSLILFTVVLNSILVISGFVASHYFNFDVATTLAYPPVDGFCTIGLDSIGKHCFSDYTFPRMMVFTDDPWKISDLPLLPYTAGGLLPALLFGTVGSFFHTPILGTSLYLLTGIFCLSLPIWHATKGKSFTTRTLLIPTFGAISVAAFVALDRGNNIVFTVPALYFFAVGLIQRKNWLSILGISIAVLIKPQFIILLFAIVFFRYWKLLIITVATIGVSNLLAYAFWPTRFPNSIFDTIQNILGFGDQPGMLLDERIGNISLSRGVYFMELVARNIFDKDISHSWTLEHSSAVGYVTAALLIVFTAIFARKNPLWVSIASLIAISSMVLSTSYAYYSVFSIVIASLIIREDSRITISGSIQEFKLNRMAGVLVALASALTISRILLPAVSPSNEVLLQTSLTVIPIIWVFTIVVIGISALFTRSEFQLIK